jgi:hypothetical protein
MTAPSAFRLEQAVATLQAARARMAEAGLSPEDISEAVGPENGDVRDALARLLRHAVLAEATADAMTELQKRMADRKARYQRQASEARATAFAVMDALGERKVQFPDLTVSIRPGQPRAVVLDVDALPDAFVAVERKPRLREILAALQAGEDVPGATLNNGIDTLTVRTS